MEKKKQAKTEIEIPEGAIFHDDCFYVWKTRYGLYSSMTKEGRKMSTGATEEGVTHMTRWTLKCEQDGTLHLYTRVINATSGVKL